MTSWRFIKTSEDWRHQCRFIFWHTINISPLRMKEQRHVPPSWEIFYRKSQSLKGITPAFQKGWVLSPAPMYLLLIRQYKLNTWPHTMQIPWKWGIEIISVFYHERRKEYSAIILFLGLLPYPGIFHSKLCTLEEAILVLILLDIYLHSNLVYRKGLLLEKAKPLFLSKYANWSNYSYLVVRTSSWIMNSKKTPNNNKFLSLHFVSGSFSFNQHCPQFPDAIIMDCSVH